jgi:hypothetical protein
MCLSSWNKIIITMLILTMNLLSSAHPSLVWTTFRFTPHCYCRSHFTIKYVCTRWFKYDRNSLCVNKPQFVPVIFEPPCICRCFILLNHSHLILSKYLPIPIIRAVFMYFNIFLSGSFFIFNGFCLKNSSPVPYFLTAQQNAFDRIT